MASGKVSERDIARILEEAEVLTSEQWEDILDKQRENRKEISEILEEEGLISAEEHRLLEIP